MTDLSTKELEKIEYMDPEEVKKRIETLDDGMEYRCIVPFDSRDKITKPLIVAHENRFGAGPKLGFSVLADVAEIESYKRANCKREGEELTWIEPNILDMAQAKVTASREEFVQALVNGVEIIEPPK